MCPKGASDGKPLCINRSQLCDDKQDCEDGADEEAACCKCLCDFSLVLSLEDRMKLYKFILFFPQSTLKDRQIS